MVFVTMIQCMSRLPLPNNAAAMYMTFTVKWIIGWYLLLMCMCICCYGGGCSSLKYLYHRSEQTRATNSVLYLITCAPQNVMTMSTHLHACLSVYM